MMPRLTSPKTARNCAREQRAPRRRPRGLTMLATLLAVAGLIRIGLGVTSAIAGESALAPPAQVAEAGSTCLTEPGLDKMVADLRDRAAQLATRETVIAQREQALALAQSRVDEKLVALKIAQEKLSATIAEADHAADKDVSSLVAMYEAMKPKDAARLFAEMQPDFAAGFIVKMKPELAAAVLAGLDPAKAYSISAVLAGRNANAPTN